MNILSRNLRWGLSACALVAAGSAAGCSSDPPAEALAPSDPLGSALERDTGVPWNVVRDSDGHVLIATPNGTAKPLVPGATPEVAAREFFQRYATLLGATTADAASLAVSDVRADATHGVEHVILEQRIGDVLVWDSGASVHVTTDGSLAWVEPTLVAGTERLPSAPAVTALDAGTRARAELAAVEPTFATATIGKPELAAVPSPSGARLAWAVRLTPSSSSAEARVVLLDAMTGHTLEVRDSVDRATATAYTARHYLPPPFATDERRSFTVEPFLSIWWMKEPVVRGLSGGVEVQAYLATVGDLSVGGMLMGDVASDKWDATGKAGAGSAVDASFNVSTAAAWFESAFQRYAYRGNGRMDHIRVLVHHGIKGGGAQFSPFEDAISFADFEHGSIIPPAVALDIAGHEYAHAMIHSFANARPYRILLDKRTGLLNEGLTDIFAAFIEHEARPGPGNLLFGEETAGSGAVATRDLVTPSSPEVRQPQIDRYTPGLEASGIDPHTTAGVVTKAWSMMTVGGDFHGVAVPESLGWDKSQDLWWRTLTSLSRNPYSWLPKTVAIRQLRQAKWSLHWSAREVDAVACAWIAVDVLTKLDALVEVGSKPVCFGIGASPQPPATSKRESPCAGNVTGYACNPLAPYSAFVCKDGSPVGGVMCREMAAKCKRASAKDASATAVDGKLVCE